MEIQFNDPVKQQIWQTLRALNDAWTKGNPDDLANFFHQDMLAITPIDQFRREGRTNCIAGWKDFSSRATISQCESPRELRRLQPLREWSHEQSKQIFTRSA